MKMLYALPCSRSPGMSDREVIAGRPPPPRRIARELELSAAGEGQRERAAGDLVARGLTQCAHVGIPERALAAERHRARSRLDGPAPGLSGPVTAAQVVCI